MRSGIGGRTWDWRSATLAVPLALALVAVQIFSAAAQSCSPSSTVYVSIAGSNVGCCGTDSKPCATLARAVRRVTAGGSILLQPGTHSSNGAPVDIGGRTLTIRAADPDTVNTTILDCAKGGCLEATTCSPQACPEFTLSLQGFTVRNGAGASGGCLDVAGQSLDLQNMSFRACSASTKGGAISLANVAGSVETTSILSSSVSSGLYGGGGMYLSKSNVTAKTLVVRGCSASQSFGGCIQAAGSTLSLSAQSLLTGCSANLYGGALYSVDSQVDVTYSTLSDSEAFGLGGCWFDNKGIVKITVGYLLNCVVKLPPPPAQASENPSGAGIYAKETRSLLVENSEISGASSALDGGAIFLASCPMTNITGSLISGCSVEEGSGAGIASYLSNLEVSNSLFKDNQVRFMVGQGGGIYAMDSNITVVGSSRFIGNGISLGMSMSQQGGAIAYDVVQPMKESPVKLYIEGAYFEANAAATGGALWAFDRVGSGVGISMSLKDTKFVANTASYGAAVGAFAGMDFVGCTFVNNSAMQNGAGVYVAQENVYINITDSTFINNTAVGGFGGGVGIPSGGRYKATILGSHFIGNSAPLSVGGGLSHGGVEIQVQDTEFTLNRAGIAGGAVAVEGSGLESDTSNAASQGTFTNCTFANNYAPRGGAGVHASTTGTAMFRECTFSGNNGTQGGAILLTDYAELQFVDLTCSGNSASEGSCLALTDKTRVTVTRGQLSNNKAINQGGLAKITGQSVLELTRCNVSQNSAGVGGAIWAEIRASLRVVSSNFSNNEAKFMGGAVFQTHQSSTTWKRCVFDGNSGAAGSSIYADSYSNLTASRTQWLANRGSAVTLKGLSVCKLTSALFSDNRASSGEHGGAVRASDSATLVVSSKSVFSTNRATWGGAVYSDAQASVTLNNSRFESNTAQQGGAVAVGGEVKLTVLDSDFEANSARFGGALALSDASSGLVSDSKFTQNEARASGAGVYLQRSAPADGSPAPLSFSNLTFNGSVAASSQGAAFFDASFDPRSRVTCAGCRQLTDSDSFGSLPTFYRYIWPGQNDTGMNNTFRVLASSGDPIVSLEIMVLDGSGRLATDDDTSRAFVTPTPRISGLLKGTAQNGIISIPSIAVTVPAGDLADLVLEVTVSSPGDAYPPIARSLHVGFCEAGTYYSTTSYACEACPLGQWCAAGQPTQFCPDGSFSFQLGATSPANCAGCEGGLKCSQGNSTILEGFWLDANSLPLRPAVYGCDQSRGCAGFQYRGEVVDQCKPGYEQRLCSVCSSGYYGFLSSCSRCSEGYKAAFPLVAFVVIVLWIGLNYLTSLFTGADIMVVEMQFLAIVGAFNLNYFGGTWVNSIFQVFNITLFYPDFLGPQCVNEAYGFAARWVFTAVLPWAGAAFYLLLYLVDDVRNLLADSVQSLGWIRTRLGPLDRKWALIKSICNLLDLMYVSITIRCFQAFHWQTYDEKVLGADPTILWLSSTHVAILPFAVVYTALYMLGLPLFYAWVLAHGKAQGRLHERAYLEKYGLLYERYEPELFWWYLPMTWGRRMAYAAIFVFWGGHPDMQAYMTFLLVLVMGLTHYFVRPHKAAALDILVGVLFLGQYLYLLAGTANSYMTSYVAGNPSEAVAGTALLLYLTAAAIIMAFELQELWARFWVRQWAFSNQDEESRIKHARVPLITLSSLCGWPRKRAPVQDEQKEGPDGQLVPLEEIASWFNPDVMMAFLKTAPLSDLNLLQMIRVTYSYHVPSQEAIRQAGRILDALPKALRFSFINELLMDVDMEETAPLSASSTVTSHSSALMHRVSNSFLTTTFSGMSLEKVQSAALSADAGASLEKVYGLQRIKELRMLAEAAAGDKRKAGDTVRLLLNPRYVETITAWLLYEEFEGRRALKELLTKFNQWLLVLPTETSWFGSPTIPLWELQMRRRWRRFRAKLSL